MKNLRNIRGRGFTLIELLVVILILAILAALIVPRIVGRADEAKVGTARADIRTLGTELDKFRLDVGRYPANEEGLQALTVQPSDADGWKGPYLKKDSFVDPWGTEYYYETPGPDGADFLIMSFGMDKAEGGDGLNADITNLD
jgi:general secretion pathway protein G